MSIRRISCLPAHIWRLLWTSCLRFFEEDHHLKYKEENEKYSTYFWHFLNQYSPYFMQSFSPFLPWSILNVKMLRKSKKITQTNTLCWNCLIFEKAKQHRLFLNYKYFFHVLFTWCFLVVFPSFCTSVQPLLGESSEETKQTSTN